MAQSDFCRAATGGSCDSEAYHPDFSDVGNSAVLLKHPLVVGEQQLEAESEREDEGEPQQSAEDQRRHHGLTLGTEGDMETGDREGERTMTGCEHTTVCLTVIKSSIQHFLGFQF